VPRWTKLAGAQDCKSASCPAIYLSDDGQLLVQGRRASDDVRARLALGTEEDAVEISTDLFMQALGALRQPGDAR
jgi:hypothetical protein